MTLNDMSTNVIKTIYTVIPYYSNGYEVNINEIKSFTARELADQYTNTLQYNFEFVENELILF